MHSTCAQEHTCNNAQKITGVVGCSNAGEVLGEADEGVGRQVAGASSPGFSRHMQNDGQLSVCTPPLVAMFVEWIERGPPPSLLLSFTEKIVGCFHAYRSFVVLNRTWTMASPPTCITEAKRTIKSLGIKPVQTKTSSKQPRRRSDRVNIKCVSSPQ